MILCIFLLWNKDDLFKFFFTPAFPEIILALSALFFLGLVLLTLSDAIKKWLFNIHHWYSLLLLLFYL